MDNNKTGKFILSLRQEKGLSQYQLAEMIPISRQAVSKWERGENIPDSYTLLKLSEIFNVSINELLLGERQLDNSVESLEKTTLSILDESNKKSRKIKKLLITFTTIITVLLLAFLSYYFITSYNSIQVYTISGDDGKVKANDGILVTTREKYYLKLGKLIHNDNIKINNIKFCYIKDNKEVIINDDLDESNIILFDYYGYAEIINNSDLDQLKNNSYLKIKYNYNQEEILKLRFKRDFINSSLFIKKNPNWKKNTNNKVKPKEKEVIVKEEDKATEKVEEEKKEETKKEETKEQTVETPKQEVKPVVNEPKEEPKTTNPEPVVEEITIAKIIDKIKEKGTYSDEGYFYELNADNKTITYMYEDKMNQVMMFDTIGDSWLYFENMGLFTCEHEYNEELCKNFVFENARQYLFK